MSHWSRFATYREWVDAGRPAPPSAMLAIPIADARRRIAENPLARQADERAREFQRSPRAYHELSTMERHDLWQRDPARFNALRAEHHTRLAELEQRLRSARTLAERSTIHAELARLGA